jgi:hypothetical protein
MTTYCVLMQAVVIWSIEERKVVVCRLLWCVTVVWCRVLWCVTVVWCRVLWWLVLVAAWRGGGARFAVGNHSAILSLPLPLPFSPPPSPPPLFPLPLFYPSPSSLAVFPDRDIPQSCTVSRSRQDFSACSSKICTDFRNYSLIFPSLFC